MDEKEIVTEEQKPKKKKAIWRRKYIHEVTSENDIKFRAPLSYRHLRMIGWLFLAISQIAVILRFGESIYSNPGMYGNWPQILSVFSSLMSPLFLIAVFAIVLNAKDGYRRLLILYGGLTVLIFLLFLFVYEHYLVGLLKVSSSSSEAHATMAQFLSLISGNGFIAFNFFLDLFLCALVTFFINYRPTKFFQGKKIIIFRLFVLIPILYEIASICLKIAASVGTIQLTPYLYPLLTTKPPVAFIIFIAMAFFVKAREKFFIKKGKTHEEYDAFQHTNVNSLHFSIFLSITILIAAIIDVAIMIGLWVGMTNGAAIPEGYDAQTYAMYTFATVFSWGFGGCATMILVIPLVLLFDYKKTYDDGKFDLFIPIIGIVLILIVYIEGGYEVLRVKLAQLIDGISKEGGETPPEQVTQTIKQIIGRFKAK